MRVSLKPLGTPPQEVDVPDDCWQKVLGLAAKKGLPGFVVDANDPLEMLGADVWEGCVVKEGAAKLSR